MAARVALEAISINPCCTELKKKYTTLMEKRNALRQAVKLLEHQVNKLLSENNNLNKLRDEECKRTELEKEAKIKECNIRQKLEKELNYLKSEISSYQESAVSRNFSEDEVKLLEARTVESESEIRSLRELLEREKKRGVSEQKKATAEKEKASEVKKLLVIEKGKAEENRRLAETERKRAQEYRDTFEKLKSEAKEIREKLIVENSKADEATKKVEIEKQKTHREKMRADSERTKAEEQTKLVELHRNKAIDAKVHVDHLSQQLAEEKQKREDLQKKMEEIGPAPREREVWMSGPDSETANVKLLRKQLKLEKKRVKYAKRAAQLHKAEKRFIGQQVNQLKQEFVQLSFRLNMLDGCLSHGTEGKEGMTKIDESPELLGINLKNKVFGISSCGFSSVSEFRPTKSCSNDLSTVSDPSEELTAHHFSAGSCTRPISGISSELESPIRDSIRNKSQSSAVCSTTTTFSDRTFMGTQGGDDLLITSSNKLTTKSSKRRTSTDKASNIRQDENSDRRHIPRSNVSANLNSSLHGEPDIRERLSSLSTKRRRTDKALESIAWLLTEDGLLHLKLEDKLSVLRDILTKKDGLKTVVEFSNGLETGKDLLAEENDDLSKRHYRHGKSSEEPVSVTTTDQAALICSGNVNFGDYLKLLELDNEDDERRFREAMETPLSPPLPEISSPRVESHYLAEGQLRTSEAVKGDSMSFQTIDVINLELEANKVKLKTCNRRELLSCNNQGFTHSSEEVKSSGLFTPHSDFNQNDYDEQMLDATELNDSIVNADPALSILNLKATYGQAKPSVGRLLDPSTIPNSNVCGDTVPVKIDKYLPSGDATCRILNSNVHSKPLHEERCAQSCNPKPHIIVAAQTNIFLDQEACTITEAAKETPLPSLGRIENPLNEIGRTLKFCVVFSNTKDEETILRIIHARDALLYQNFMDQADSVIVEVLDSLKLKSDLQPEEKVSAFFSFLLYGYSGTVSSNSKSFASEDILRYSEPFAAKISRVICNEKTGWLFKETCWLDILLNLIEDFLIGRKLLIYNDGESESFPYVSSCKNHLEEINILFFPRVATIDQLMAASIILSCICAAVNDIGFLLEASYKILRTCRSDKSWILLSLHVFASIIGKDFFSLNNYSLLIAVIKSVVSLVERGDESQACDEGPFFPFCKQCLFNENAISVDKLTSFLLDVLQNFSSGARCLSSLDTVPTCFERDEESMDHKYESSGQNIACSSSCMLSMYRNSTDQSICDPLLSFCHYTDIVSLVELVGCYMSWEWTSLNIMPRLLAILESCISEEFSAALFVLIGQLVRFGIDAGDCQQDGVTELISRFSKFLDAFTTVKRGFPAQFAVVGALLNILPLSFGEIVCGHVENSPSANQSHVNLIKKWFSQLSEELQSLSLSLFRSTDVYKF